MTLKKQLATAALLLTAAATATAQNTPASQMERLDRGVIVMPNSSGTGNFVSWRMLGTDDEDNTTFDVVRNGDVIASNVYKTNYVDRSGPSSSQYQIVTKVGGEVVETSPIATSWGNNFLTINLDRPAKGSNGGTYSPNDCSVGDMDGDGQYEIVLKWDPSNQHDNSESGKTDNVMLDCYRLDGTKLWRIDLGPNIRAGAHYTQFLVYDFDGDGRAEVICKTAPGSKDGTGAYVNQATTNETIKGHSNTAKHANSSGYVNSGAEYLTVFDGLTGKAIHTTWYLPNRAGNFNQVNEHPGSSYWGDSYGGRADRFLGAVAYLDGPDQNPSAVFSRGYYTRAFVWAVDYRDGQLHTKWLSDSENANYLNLYLGDELAKQPRKAYTKNTGGLSASDSNGGIAGSKTMYSNGNHNLSIADVDGDGCDEIIWGSATLDNDGYMLYAVGYGHGDAIHVSDLLPDRPGLEVFDIHEEHIMNGKGSWDVHDAATGEIIYKGGGNNVDNGRGMAADISADYRGFEFWSGDDRTPCRADNGKYTTLSGQSQNFRLYWNGDLYDELLDGHYVKNSNDAFDHVDQVNITTGDNNRIQQWTNRSLCNTTKMTPNLSADILGDWREELVLWDYQDPTKLYIHATTTETNYRMPTLMHDHVYRMGIAWQQTAYNQPPHLGYFLPDAMKPRVVSEGDVTVNVGEELALELPTRYTRIAILATRLAPDGKLATDLKGTYNATTKRVSISGTPTQTGDYKIGFKLTGLGTESVVDTITIHSVDASGIQSVYTQTGHDVQSVYDLQGRRLDAPRQGLNIIRREGKVVKVIGK